MYSQAMLLRVGPRPPRSLLQSPYKGVWQVEDLISGEEACFLGSSKAAAFSFSWQERRLLSPCESKIATTNFEPNLKQVLLNTGQGDGHWSGPYPAFPENGCELC